MESQLARRYVVTAEHGKQQFPANSAIKTTGSEVFMACSNAVPIRRQGRAIPNTALLAAGIPTAKTDIRETMRARPNPWLEDADETDAAACTDYRGTRLYSTDARDPFWPFFAHPRWLNCDMLYRNSR